MRNDVARNIRMFYIQKDKSKEKHKQSDLFNALPHNSPSKLDLTFSIAA